MAEPNFLQLLVGRTVAHDLLLRMLFAEIASHRPGGQAPADWLFESIEAIIGSMDGVKDRPGSALDQKVWEAAEAELRLFADNVGRRFDKNGDWRTPG